MGGGVMRPVGPESAETYWVRRALVIGAMLVLLIIVLIFLFNLGGSPGQAAPPQTTPQTSAAAPASPTAWPTPSPASVSPTAPSDTPTGASPSTPSVSASPSGTPSASATASSSPTSTAPNRHSSEHASNSDSKKAAGKTDSKRTSRSGREHSPSPTASAKPEPVACNAKELRPTLHSDKHSVGIGSRVRFDVSFINGSDQDCVITINPDDYQLKIYSGTDRIWSTDDCARLVPGITRTTKPEATVEWTTTWNGKRSAAGKNCKSRPEIPRAGYYYATSQLKGAKPVQFLLVLK